MAKAQPKTTLDVVMDSFNPKGKEARASLASNIDFVAVPQTGILSGIPAIDRGIGRVGFPCGRTIELSGEPGNGKTSLGYALVGQVQRIGGVGIVYDAERAYDDGWFAKQGGDPERLIYYGGTDQILTAEAIFTSLKKLLTNLSKVPFEKQDPIVVVWDSIGGTPTIGDVESEVGKRDYPELPRIISTQLPIVSQMIINTKVLFVCINQIRDNIGAVYGDKFKTPGGWALDHFCTIRGRVSRKSFVYTGPKTNRVKIGQRHEIHFHKNKVGAPQSKCEFDLMYDMGLDKARGLLNEFVSTGAVTQSQSWYTLGSTGDKWQSMDDWREVIKKNWGSEQALYEGWVQGAVQSGVLIPYGQPIVEAPQ